MAIFEIESSHLTAAGWFDRSDRCRVEIAGLDRAKFLHNLTTNDVKRLASGSGHESFVTTPQGKVLAYISVLTTETETLLIRTDQGSVSELLVHLRKYGIFEDVTIDDVSTKTFEYHLAGPSSCLLFGLSEVELPSEGALKHRSGIFAGVALRIVREQPLGKPGFTLIGPIDQADHVLSALEAASGPKLMDEIFQTLRIEAGTPVSGVDVTSGHLPQEVGRDALTINFVKGCYLGQETVARLDALGHVNRILKGLKFSGSHVPAVGSVLTFEGKTVGSVTSSGYSPGWSAPVALGYVRVAQALAGTKLMATVAGAGEVEVIVSDLPMIAPEPF